MSAEMVKEIKQLGVDCCSESGDCACAATAATAVTGDVAVVAVVAVDVAEQQTQAKAPHQAKKSVPAFPRGFPLY